MIADVSITGKGGDLVLSMRTGMRPIHEIRPGEYFFRCQHTIRIQLEEPVFLLLVGGNRDQGVCDCSPTKIESQLELRKRRRKIYTPFRKSFEAPRA